MQTNRYLTPGNIVRFLGCAELYTTPNDFSSSSPSYFLFKDGHSLVVQAMEKAWDTDLDAQNPEARLREEAKQHSFEIEVIQTLLDTIEFKQSNWAYLICDPKGQYRLVPKVKPKILYKIDAPLGWVPKIPLSEIEIVRWLSSIWFEGFWNGREIDVRVGWTDRDLKAIERDLNSRYLCRNCNITSEVYGLVVRDGLVIGYMSEPIRGRNVEFQDRMLVYETFAKLQAHNIVWDWYWDIPFGEILIQDGQIRLTMLQQRMKVISDDERKLLEASGKIFNETYLQKLFKLLMQQPNPAPNFRETVWTQDTMVLTYIPYPEHSISRAPAVFDYLWKWQWLYYQLHCQEDNCRGRSRRPSKRKTALICSSGWLDTPIPGALVRGARTKSRFNKRRSDVGALLAPE